MDRRDIHSPHRAAFPLGPGQRFVLIVQVQPIQTGDMHLRINSGRGEQTLAQLWIKKSCDQWASAVIAGL
nr:hypothetical protein GCM10020185_46000 [Pseudomonas brassicacearum subsp. brassicacearum]